MPLVQIISFDDYLMGTRSVDYQVKILSDRKDDREGQSEDLIDDDLFRFTIDMRVRRRGEPQLSIVKHLPTAPTEISGEVSQRGLILMGDRGLEV